MKTTTITLKLTDFQVRELEQLGLVLWPGEGLDLAELCRRVLLNRVDGEGLRITCDMAILRQLSASGRMIR